MRAARQSADLYQVSAPTNLDEMTFIYWTRDPNFIQDSLGGLVQNALLWLVFCGLVSSIVLAFLPGLSLIKKLPPIIEKPKTMAGQLYSKVTGKQNFKEVNEFPNARPMPENIEATIINK